MTAGFQYSQLDLRGGMNTEEGLLLHEGVGSLQNHLINLPFSRDEARITAGKAACLAAWIQQREKGLELSKDHLVLRMYLTTVRSYKKKLTERSMGDPEVERLYRQMPLPHFIWVSFPQKEPRGRKSSKPGFLLSGVSAAPKPANPHFHSLPF